MSDALTTTTPPLTSLDPLEEHLEQVEMLLEAQFDEEHSSLMLALRQLIRSGGKRIRPRLVLLTGCLLGAEANRLIPLAAAIEMLHTASLIHDDLIDGSSLRRGMETLNMQWSPIVTVLTGDFAFTSAAELATSVDSIPVMRLFSKSMSMMVAGELHQLIKKESITSQDEYYQWISAKTATLFELAAGAAALLSQVDQDLVACARRYGHELGMAFQIIDDILDMTCDQASLGKPVGSDLRQGVLTLPSLIFIKSHPRNEIVAALNSGYHLEDQLIEQLLIDIRRSDAIPQTLKIAQAFIQRGLEALDYLPEAPEKNLLAELTRSVIERKN